MRTLCTYSHIIGSHFNSHVLPSIASRGQSVVSLSLSLSLSLSPVSTYLALSCSHTYIQVGTVCQNPSKFENSYPGPPRSVKLLYKNHSCSFFSHAQLVLLLSAKLSICCAGPVLRIGDPRQAFKVKL